MRQPLQAGPTRVIGPEFAARRRQFRFARRDTKSVNSARGNSTQSSDDYDSQPLKKTGTYGDSTGMVAHDSDNCLTLPPRGFEPLSPA